MKALIIPFLLLLGCSSSVQEAFSERRLTTLPEEGQPRGFKFSRDGRAVAFILDAAGKDHLILGAERGSPFDKI